MGVSKNNGTPKSSISIVFSIINHPFWGIYPYFWKHPYDYDNKMQFTEKMQRLLPTTWRSLDRVWSQASTKVTVDSAHVCLTIEPASGRTLANSARTSEMLKKTCGLSFCFGGVFKCIINLDK